ncbi:MAG: hypothetical protein Q4B56_08005 [Erysipelotrichaceae bacterium]|nr:hypothetical protein [Erysipelotrichaceae bacterium]
MFGPHIVSTKVYIGSVYDDKDQLVDICNKPMQIVKTKWSGPIEKYAMIRKIR